MAELQDRKDAVESIARSLMGFTVDEITEIFARAICRVGTDIAAQTGNDLQMQCINLLTFVMSVFSKVSNAVLTGRDT